MSDVNPDLAIVDAGVTEAEQVYQGGQEIPGRARNENLRVRYDFVRKDGRWLISDMGVL